MESEVIAAAITGVATLLAAVIGVWAVRQKRERRKDEDAFRTAPRLSTSTHRVVTVESRTEFDEQGCGRHVRRWLGLKTEQSLQNLRIPYRMSATGPHGSIGRPVVKETDGSLLTATWHGEVESAVVVEGSIVLNGFFTPKTGFVGYQLEQTFEHAFFTSRKEAEAAYREDEWRTEYIGISIRDPIETLKMSVAFPPAYGEMKPPPTAVVFIGASERVHRLETERVGAALTVTGTLAVLAVDKPLEGMQYAIAWMPPDAPAARPGP